MRLIDAEKRMRLIDANKLCEDLLTRWELADKNKEDVIRQVMADIVTPIVVSQPTVDAVEVVRCKDCVHKCVCPLYGGSQFFCAYGEKGESDEQMDSSNRATTES